MSLPPHQCGRIYPFKGVVALYWPLLAVSAIAIGVGSVLNVPDLVAGRNEPYALNWFLVSIAIGLPPLAIVWWKNRSRVKWVRTSEAEGIEWFRRGRVWTQSWDQIKRINLVSVFHTQENGALRADHQTMFISFTDHTKLRLKSWECVGAWYLPFRDFVDRKHALTDSIVKGEYTAPRAQNTKAKGPAVFGPLTIHDNGLEWDGKPQLWGQIEVCALHDNFLIVQCADGSEFMKRTTELGDWQHAISLLDAAARYMSLRPIPDEAAGAPAPAAV
jgi:hypothetical protein